MPGFRVPKMRRIMGDGVLTFNPLHFMLRDGHSQKLKAMEQGTKRIKSWRLGLFECPQDLVNKAPSVLNIPSAANRALSSSIDRTLDSQSLPPAQAGCARRILGSGCWKRP